MFNRLPKTPIFTSALLLALTGCAPLQTMLEQPASPAIEAETAGQNPPADAAPAKKVSVNDVPRRPIFGYAVEQKREIEQGLVRDRELAQHAQNTDTRPAVRHVAIAPPPNVEPETPQANDDQAAAVEPAPDLAVIDEIEPEAIQSSTVIDAGVDGLNDLLKDIRRLFLDPIEKFTPDAEAPAAPAQPAAGASAIEPAAAPPAVSDLAAVSAPRQLNVEISGSNDPAQSQSLMPQSTELDEFSDFVTEQIGVAPTGTQAALADRFDNDVELAAIEPAAAPAARKLPPHDGTALIDVPLDRGVSQLDEGQTGMMRTTLDRFDLANSRLIAVGNAADPALALRRARATALALIEAGVPSAHIVVKAGNSGEGIVVRATAL